MLELTSKLFAWLRKWLGIEIVRQEMEWHSRSIEEKLIEIQSQLNAMQVDKLKVYVREQKDKPKPVAVDYEASQQQTLKEFEGE